MSGWARRSSWANSIVILGMTVLIGTRASGQETAVGGSPVIADQAKAASPGAEPPAPSPGTPAPTSKPAEAPAKLEPKPFDIWTANRGTGNWGGVRTWMDDTGIDFGISYTPVFQALMHGGRDRTEDFNGDLRLNLTLDFEKMKLIPGGFFFARGKSSYNNGLAGEAGSLSSTSYAIAAGDEEMFLDKWWYGQRFFKDKIELRFGKLLTPVDLFDTNAYAGNPWNQFLNSFLNANPLLPHRKAFGAYLKLKPTDWLYFSTAAIDADEPNPNRCWSTDVALHGPARYVGFWELGLTPTIKTEKGPLPGNYRAGFTYDPRVREVFLPASVKAPYRSARGDDVGFYTSVDQLVWKENADPKDKQGLGLFARYGFRHQDINKISQFWSVGAQYQGLIPTRNKDVLAFGVGDALESHTYRHAMNPLADRETVYEMYYAIAVTPWLTVFPDIQVIVNPGGNTSASDAFIGGIKVKMDL